MYFEIQLLSLSLIRFPVTRLCRASPLNSRVPEETLDKCGHYRVQTITVHATYAEYIDKRAVKRCSLFAEVTRVEAPIVSSNGVTVMSVNIGVVL